MVAITVGSSVPLSLAPGGVGPATLTVQRPDGTMLSPAPTVTATPEAFLATIDTTQVGRHLLTWNVPGEDAWFTDVIDVWPSDPRYLVPVATALAQVSGSNTPQETKDLMPLYVATATYVIEQLAGPVLSASRTLTVDGGRPIVLPAAPVTVTSVTAGGSLLATTQYTVDTAAGVIYNVPSYGLRTVTVVYQVGAQAVPANLQLAALELIRHLWQSSKQRGTGGQLQAAADTVAPFGFAVPKRVVELCQATPGAPGFA